MVEYIYQEIGIDYGFGGNRIYISNVNWTQYVSYIFYIQPYASLYGSVFVMSYIGASVHRVYNGEWSHSTL